TTQNTNQKQPKTQKHHPKTQKQPNNGVSHHHNPAPHQPHAHQGAESSPRTPTITENAPPFPRNNLHGENPHRQRRIVAEKSLESSTSWFMAKHPHHETPIVKESSLPHP
ncbi:hypothetical protein, partial [Pseudoscardovia radai]|uniref:hypothetical protein n=1 Tax=Pseudoscardovia radai TaxID=987066 RepID=UPI0039941CE4